MFEVLKLNVGGKLFETQPETLTDGDRVEGSRLQATFANNPELQQKAASNEQFFIDRNPDTFQYILNWIRSGCLSRDVLKDPCLKQRVLIEARFFQLPQLVMALEDDANPSSEQHDPTQPLPDHPLEAIMHLNVGGTRFQTTLETLTTNERAQGSRLQATFENSDRPWSKINFFIDRNPELFAHILDWLRTGQLHTNLLLNHQSFRAEAAFFELSLLEEALRPELTRLLQAAAQATRERGDPFDASFADLSGFDLSNLDMTGWDLRGANLTGANLTNASLTGATLGRVNLTNAKMQGVNLTNANLKNAKLDSANLTNATLNSTTKLDGADLSNANLSGATLQGVNLTTAAKLDHVTLSNANLTKANLTGANLTNANLTGATLARVNVKGCNFNSAVLAKSTIEGKPGVALEKRRVPLLVYLHQSHTRLLLSL